MFGLSVSVTNAHTLAPDDITSPALQCWYPGYFGLTPTFFICPVRVYIIAHSSAVNQIRVPAVSDTARCQRVHFSFIIKLLKFVSWQAPDQLSVEVQQQLEQMHEVLQQQSTLLAVLAAGQC